FSLTLRLPPTSTLFPYTTLFRSSLGIYELGKAYQLSRLLLGAYRKIEHNLATVDQLTQLHNRRYFFAMSPELMLSAQISGATPIDRKSTRLNSSHVKISYAVFCL